MGRLHGRVRLAKKIHRVAKDFDFGSGCTLSTTSPVNFAGGAEGILTAYLSDQLERFGEGERQGVMKALLALGNLDNNQRVAEGKTVEELSATAQLPANRLGACLDYLASPHVRLLEKLPATGNGPTKYRLPHDRIVSSLRRLAGLILPDALRAQLIFDEAFRAWLNRRNGRLLLAGKELKRVVKNRDQFPGGTLSGERAEFLKLSLQKHVWRRLRMLGLAFMLATLVIFSWREYESTQGERTSRSGSCRGTCTNINPS